jgi:hypothetical protein
MNITSTGEPTSPAQQAVPVPMLGFGIQVMGAESEFGHASAVWDIAQVARTPEGKSLLKRYLKEITEGPAFKGSPRSAQFLEYIVWHSATEKPSDLKERTIGVALFGRSPTYDTGEDAIVRVTASDVRKRLAQHYSGAGISSAFRINLPSGGYVPELIRIPRVEAEDAAHWLPPARNPAEIPDPLPAAQTAWQYATPSGWKYWTLPILGIVALMASIALALINHAAIPSVGKSFKGSNAAPWATLFDGSRPVVIIASDPSIEEIQRVTHSSLSLSDYANQSYLPPGMSSLPPSQMALMKEILRGNTISAFDGSIIANLASLMTPGQSPLTVKAARNFRIKDIQTDENLIFLGSPRSNPWTSMFYPALDFQFGFNIQTQREFIRNLHPERGESSEYIPTAGGFDTGESFAIVSLFHNPGYRGRVLILAGASGEGTAAAGNLVADPARWAAALQSCHLAGDNPGQSLQVLLHLESIAGSPGTVNTVACHRLASAN